MSKTITLSDAEYTLLGIFLKELGEAHDNAGCNEMRVPFSPEMMDLVHEAEKNAYGEQYDEDDLVYVNKETLDQKIYTQDHVLLRYLKEKLGL